MPVPTGAGVMVSGRVVSRVVVSVGSQKTGATFRGCRATCSKKSVSLKDETMFGFIVWMVLLLLSTLSVLTDGCEIVNLLVGPRLNNLLRRYGKSK